MKDLNEIKLELKNILSDKISKKDCFKYRLFYNEKYLKAYNDIRNALRLLEEITNE